MGELEPTDSRDVTGSNATAPGEPPRTGPREDQARARAGGGQPQQQSQQQSQDEPAEAGGPKDIEGDSPEHPDRMGAFAGETAQGEQDGQQEGQQGGSQQQSDQGDRWHQKAQQASND